MGRNTLSEELTAIDNKLCDVILEAHKRGFTVQSDFARTYADYVAMAASMGLISTRVHSNVYSREWRPTVFGLRWLNEIDLDGEDV